MCNQFRKREVNGNRYPLDTDRPQTECLKVTAHLFSNLMPCSLTDPRPTAPTLVRPTFAPKLPELHFATVHYSRFNQLLRSLKVFQSQSPLLVTFPLLLPHTWQSILFLSTSTPLFYLSIYCHHYPHSNSRISRPLNIIHPIFAFIIAASNHNSSTLAALSTSILGTHRLWINY